MKKILITLSVLLPILSQGQEQAERYTAHNKGKFFVFWGGNRGYYSKSDINFSGKDYNFTLYEVAAVDKPKGYHIDYINPLRMTIPQTNARVGYYLTDHLCYFRWRRPYEIRNVPKPNRPNEWLRAKLWDDSRRNLPQSG